MLEHTLACIAPMVITSKKFQIPKEVQTPKAILRKSENSYNPVCVPKSAFLSALFKAIPSMIRCGIAKERPAPTESQSIYKGECAIWTYESLNQRVYPRHQNVRSADRASLKFSSSIWKAFCILDCPVNPIVFPRHES